MAKHWQRRDHGQRDQQQRDRGGNQRHHQQQGPKIYLTLPENKDEAIKTSDEGKHDVTVKVFVIDLPAGQKVVAETKVQGKGTGIKEFTETGEVTLSVPGLDTSKDVYVDMKNLNTGQQANFKLELPKEASSKPKDRLVVHGGEFSVDGFNPVHIEIYDKKGKPEKGTVRIVVGQGFEIEDQGHFNGSLTVKTYDTGKLSLRIKLDTRDCTAHFEHLESGEIKLKSLLKEA